MRFQSLVGRLKTGLIRYALPGVTPFQSLVGRLKTVSGIESVIYYDGVSIPRR